MKPKIRLLSVILLILGIVVGLQAQQLSELSNVQLENIKTGELQNPIAEIDGPVIIVSFSIFCGPCIKELKAFNEQSEKWEKDYRATIIAVSNDIGEKYRKKLSKFEKKRALIFPLYLDSKGDLAKTIYSLENIDQEQFYINESNYRIKNPQTFVLDKNGNLLLQKRGYISGDEIKIEKAFYKHK
jgi:peroxiredoxin